MWQGSQNLYTALKKARAQNKKMTGIGYISDTEEIVKVSWSIFHHDSVAAFNVSERLPMPPALSAKNRPRGQTEILNVRRVTIINCYPIKSDEDSTAECVSDTENCLIWNCDLGNLHVSDDDCAADDQCDIEQNNCVVDPECPEQQDVSAAPAVFGVVRPTCE
jgi:hypothetical protein